ncbi:hypothetical protein IGI04_011154, partial [Brassica rapa subsp. trilocularis]
KKKREITYLASKGDTRRGKIGEARVVLTPTVSHHRQAFAWRRRKWIWDVNLHACKDFYEAVTT